MARKPSPVKSNYRPWIPLGPCFPTSVPQSLNAQSKHLRKAYHKVLITGTSPISSRLYGASACLTSTRDCWGHVHSPALSSCSDSRGLRFLPHGWASLWEGPKPPPLVGRQSGDQVWSQPGLTLGLSVAVMGSGGLGHFLPSRLRVWVWVWAVRWEESSLEGQLSEVVYSSGAQTGRPWTSGSTRVLVRSVNSWVPVQAYRIWDSGNGVQGSAFQVWCLTSTYPSFPCLEILLTVANHCGVEHAGTMGGRQRLQNAD